MTNEALPDPTGERVTLSATTGSPLAEFITALTEAWPARRLLARVEPVSALEFTSLRLCEQTARRCLVDLWNTLAREHMMPLARPSVTWYIVPEPCVIPRRDDSATTGDEGVRRRFRATPGIALPSRQYAVECIAAVHAVPLPPARDTPDADLPPTRR